MVPSTALDASSGTHLQRIKGTVGFSTAVGASKNDVVTSAVVADGNVAYAGCSSLAALDFPSGATAMIGGGTNLKVPTDGAPAYLDSGVVQYRSDIPFSIGTKYGTVTIKRGTGYVLSGTSGVEIVSVDAGATDVVFATDSASYAVPGGKSLDQPVSDGHPGTAVIVDNTEVNNPALYQFNQGRNPLQSDAAKSLDPTGTRSADCKFATAVAAGEVGAIIAALLGAGAVAAVSMGNGGGGNILPATPTPFPTLTPSPTGSASSGPTTSPSSSAVPTVSPSASAAPTSSSSPASSPSPTSSASAAPSASPTAKPSAAPSASAVPTATPSSGPSTAPSPSPSAALGPVVVTPGSVLLNPGLGASATATLSVSQSGYTGTYTAAVSGCTGVGSPPTATVVSTGPGTANVILTSTGTLNLNLGCTVTITGGNGDTATVPVTVTLAAGGTPTPSPSPSTAPSGSPSPTASPTLGPVSLNPTAILLDPGIGSSASATIAVTQPGYTGSYTAAVSGCTGVGSPPTATVVSTGPGTANVILTSTGVVNLNLACTVTVTGGGGDTASDPVTVTLSAASSPTPSPNPSASPTSAALGPVILNPSSVLLNPGLGSVATVNVGVSQSGYTGGFTADAKRAFGSKSAKPFSVALDNCVGVGTPPSATITSTGPGTANLAISATGVLNLNLGCTATVTGGGGMTAVESMTIVLVAGASPTPSPSPTAGGAVGDLTVNPTSIFLNPGLGSAATAAIAVTQPNFTGTFKATVSGCTGVGSKPVAAVTGTGTGTATVTITASGVLNANLGCNVVIRGGKGQSATVPVTITLAVGGTPTPTPSPTGTALGTLTANPASILLLPGVGANATANVVATQANYTGAFGATLSCPISLNQPPSVTVSATGAGGQAVVTVSVGGTIAASIACTLTISGGGGQKVAVPVTVGATVGGGATPTPGPSGSPGPLAANPASVLLNPGVTSSAAQNIALTDPGYVGPYTAGIACATGSLPQALQNLFVTPTVTVSGSTLTVTVPGEPLGLSLGCNVAVTTTVPQSLTVPVTISVAALQGLKRTANAPQTATMVFAPAAVTMQPRGARAAGSFTVAGAAGPYAASVSCPADADVRATALGNLIELDQLRAAGTATCMVTVKAANGTTSEVPVRTYAAVAIGAPVSLPGIGRIALGRTSLDLRIAESQRVSIVGTGPFAFGGCEAVATIRPGGDGLAITGRAAGTCTLTVRGAGGATASLPLRVEAAQGPRR